MGSDLEQLEAYERSFPDKEHGVFERGEERFVELAQLPQTASGMHMQILDLGCGSKHSGDSFGLSYAPVFSTIAALYGNYVLGVDSARNYDVPFEAIVADLIPAFEDASGNELERIVGRYIKGKARSGFDIINTSMLIGGDDSTSPALASALREKYPGADIEAIVREYQANLQVIALQFLKPNGILAMDKRRFRKVAADGGEGDVLQELPPGS